MPKSELDLRFEAARDALMAAYPGLVGVGFGRKETEGEVTDRSGLRVFVWQKKPAAALSPDELIPAEFMGFVTDVLVVEPVIHLEQGTCDGPDEEPSVCAHPDPHKTLIGGIQVTNGRHGPDGKLHLGTLGCIGRIIGEASRDRYALLSNRHVLGANGAQVGDPVFHPTGSMLDTTGESNKHEVGKIISLPPEGNHLYSYYGEPPEKYYVDAAAARIHTGFSSWCDSNCGIGIANELRGLGSGITGVERVTRDDVDDNKPRYYVYKSGRTTGPTRGWVIAVDEHTTIEPQPGVFEIVYNLMKIIPDTPDCSGQMRFTHCGDSGSVVVNEKRKAVGLLYGQGSTKVSVSGSTITTTTSARACHIHPVLDAVGLSLNDSVPGGGPAIPAAADAPGVLAGGGGHPRFQAARGRLLATPEGAEAWALIGRLRPEVVELVNHRRPVTVAWHRAKGPAFLGHLRESTRDDAHAVPAEIDGVTLRDALARMGAALREHGSPALREAIDAHTEAVLAAAADARRAEDLLIALQPVPA